MKRKWLALPLALLSTVIVVGCGNASTGNSSGKSSSESGNGGTTTIAFWDVTSTTDDPAIIKDFEAKYPNIKVKLTTYSTDGIKQAEKVNASSASLPDVFFDWGGTLASYYEKNELALDLTPYEQKMGWDTRFSKLALQLGSYGGKLYIVPTQLNGMGLYYRKDIFQKYGLTPPKTFSQLEADANILKSHGITPFGLGGLHHWYTMRYVDALLEHYAGPKLHDQLMSLKANWNNSKVIQTYSALQRWYKSGYFIPGFLSIDESQDAIQFEQGKAAMLLTGPWMDAKFNQDKFPMAKVGFFEFPEDQTPNRLSSFTQGYMISAKSQHVSADLKFLDFYTSNANLKKYQKTLGGPFANVQVPPPASQPNARVIQKDLAKDGGFLVSDQFLPQQLVQDYWQANDSVITGSMTPAQAAAFMAKSVEQFKQSNQ